MALEGRIPTVRWMKRGVRDHAEKLKQMIDEAAAASISAAGGMSEETECPTIYLEGVHSKAGKRRSIPLNDGAVNALKQMMAFRADPCPATPWVFARGNGERVMCLRTGFNKACATAGIEDFTIHDLRHTCAAHLISAGVALAEVRDLLGHSTVMMTERYAHLAPARVRDAVRVLDQARERPSSRSVHAESPAWQGGALLKLVTP
ncbi:site-specific integrase [Pseudomonas putida]|uniref:site-specific integrase n=1 Tax=Pseudomonas putida TaxID=303 RepID=UPI0009BE7F7C